VLSARRLRKKFPTMKRPYVIPWGAAGLVYVVIAPIAMGILALICSDPFALKWGPLPVLFGVLMYFIFPKLKTLMQS
jgi:hypothetical protein